MLELLHKVDQSKNGNSVNAFDAPGQAATDISVAYTLFNLLTQRGFRLQLAPPSQTQPPSIHAPLSCKLLNDIYSGQLDHEAGYQGQVQPNSTSSFQSLPALDVAFKRENWDKISGSSGLKDNERTEANEHVNSLAIPSVRNQLQDKKKLQHQHNSSAKDQLSQYFLGEIDYTKSIFAGLTSSGQKLPIIETKLSSQSSISCLSQQVGSSRMLHDVSTTISARVSILYS
ncbi:hypothetical protein MUK42_28643 [Musa troglodytarum]|uniref:Uncharacterized protein n=1 Tax=Musa troglodytarum TaxID=320322 RepID=A0A9E7FDY6_9LILI|nr:hypothetical protein MUK42_28643 [Musa troglodytarum]